MCVDGLVLASIKSVEYLVCREHLAYVGHVGGFKSVFLAMGCGSKVATYHIASCTIRSIFTGPMAGLNATPTLGCASFPGSPACPEHVWWAQQVFIAVSVIRKPRGKEDCSVLKRPPTFSLPIPVPDVEQMGMLSMRGFLCLECLHHTGGRCGAGHAECEQTMGYVADSEENAKLTMQDGTSCAAK